jgi:hypothetical protein
VVLVKDGRETLRHLQPGMYKNGNLSVAPERPNAREILLYTVRLLRILCILQDIEARIDIMLSKRIALLP